MTEDEDRSTGYIGASPLEIEYKRLVGVLRSLINVDHVMKYTKWGIMDIIRELPIIIDTPHVNHKTDNSNIYINA